MTGNLCRKRKLADSFIPCEDMSSCSSAALQKDLGSSIPHQYSSSPERKFGVAGFVFWGCFSFYRKRPNCVKTKDDQRTRPVLV